MKPVVTYRDADLQSLADSLYAAVDRFSPDIVVGIENGGARLVDALERAGVFRTSVRLQRPTTERKHRLRSVLGATPRWGLNALRRIEDRLLARHPPTPRVETPDLRADLDRAAGEVAARRALRVLVIDDAVDSGATLEAVVLGLRARLPRDVDVRSAVVAMTRTAAQRRFTPDAAIHENVLCRFPWSADYESFR